MRPGASFHLWLWCQNWRFSLHSYRQDERGGKRDSGGVKVIEKRLPSLPRSTSCHSQWASSVWEATKHTRLSCSSWFTFKSIKHTIASYMSWVKHFLYHTGCLQELGFKSALDPFWTLSAQLLLALSEFTPALKTWLFIKGATERTSRSERRGVALF